MKPHPEDSAAGHPDTPFVDRPVSLSYPENSSTYNIEVDDGVGDSDDEDYDHPDEDRMPMDTPRSPHLIIHGDGARRDDITDAMQLDNKPCDVETVKEEDEDHAMEDETMSDMEITEDFSSLPDPDTDDEGIHEDSPQQREARSMLLTWSIRVDGKYHIVICLECNNVINHEHVWGHRNSMHPLANGHGRKLRFPDKEELQNALRTLGADKPRKILPGPVLPIKGVSVLSGWRCDMPGCTTPAPVFASIKRHTEHCSRHHSGAHPRRRVEALLHRLGNIKQHLQYVEVVPTPGLNRQSLMQAMMDRNETKKLNEQPETYSVPSMCQMDPVLRASKLYNCIENVNIEIFRKTADEVDLNSEQEFIRLQSYMRRYYHRAASQLISLSTLTRRYIATKSPLDDPQPAPFERPQENDTIGTYSDFVARFIIFLMRHHFHPLVDVQLAFHPHHIDAIEHLHDTLCRKDSTDDECTEGIHQMIMSLLKFVSDGFLEDEWKELFTMFLVAFHLRDNQGNMCRAGRIPPNLSKMQWCMRASGAVETARLKMKYERNDFVAYKQEVRKYLIQGQQTLFSTLQQHMSLLSALALSEPGIPRFNWDVTRTILGIDGVGMSMHRFKSSINFMIDECHAAIREICGSLSLDDFWNHIDSKMNPMDRENCFFDDPQVTKTGSSVFTDRRNGLERFRFILMEHILDDPRFFNIDDDGKPVAAKGKCMLWNWFAKIDALVGRLYYLVVSTFGGGARGTEMDDLRYIIRGRAERHFFFLNGWGTIVTTYVKTKQLEHHGRLLARVPAPAVTRLLMALLGVIYPACAHFACDIMEIEDAKRYNEYIFVQSGRIMDSERQSRCLGFHTERLLGIPLRLRDWRQVMCSILVNIVHVDFGEPDDEDDDLHAIHRQFGHSVKVANKHYGLQKNDALEGVSHTVVASMQSVSIRYHAKLDQLHSNFSQQLQSATSDEQEEEVFTRIVILLANVLKTELQRFQSGLTRNIVDTFVTYLNGQNIRLLEYITAVQGCQPVQKPMTKPLTVDPTLHNSLHVLFPRSSRPQWTIPQQGELVQSSLGNEHVLAVLPTGCGKSMSFLGPPKLFPSLMYIVVAPLRALTNDIAKRLGNSTLKWARWMPGLDGSSLQIVLAPIDTATTHDFFIWAESYNYRLSRIFLDEAHYILFHEGFRHCMDLLKNLTRLAKPITLLSASVYPCAVPRLCAKIGIDHKELRVIRTSIARPTIAYNVVRVKPKPAESSSIDNNVLQQLHAVMARHPMGANERGLIYFTYCDRAKDYAAEIGCDYYIANVIEGDTSANDRRKDDIVRTWEEGTDEKNHWLCCTSAFSAGIDSDHVVVVVLIEANWLADFDQQAGRLRTKGGQRGWTYIIHTRLPINRDPEMDSFGGLPEMTEFLVTNGCRCLAFHGVDEDVHSCGALGSKAEKCDNCLTMQLDETVSMIPTMVYEGKLEVLEPIPIAAKPTTSGDRLRTEKAEGLYKLEELVEMFESIRGNGCVACWFENEGRRMESHKHNDEHKMNVIVASLRCIQFPVHVNWPFCFKCWIPFRHPCNHPLHAKGKTVDESKCPYSECPLITLRLIALIWCCRLNGKGHDDMLYIISDKLGVPRLRWKTLIGFKEWLRETAHNADQLPNHLEFILAYKRLFRKICVH
ncbi:uncharacterized protein LAESUDRAFT_759917 [Laetiporus sulphureus 93-53]|uniref:DNA 3'-5' helicase n=1 Tax=Laetiporus sulphureus 93-53 TaxID=1314785 RepID=A0A165DUW6_9APHY|nr:uncharacterized protein LAESUDRAFT_759917 [Laetiporus sulphureus 93-53]KZT05673.1 hypothetical protein LAESUDRAFT_759917 [Laetiporus sulphureus 93-53]